MILIALPDAQLTHIARGERYADGSVPTKTLCGKRLAGRLEVKADWADVKRCPLCEKRREGSE